MVEKKRSWMQEVVAGSLQSVLGWVIITSIIGIGMGVVGYAKMINQLTHLENKQRETRVSIVQFKEEVNIQLDEMSFLKRFTPEQVDEARKVSEDFETVKKEMEYISTDLKNYVEYILKQQLVQIESYKQQLDTLSDEYKILRAMCEQLRMDVVVLREKYRLSYQKTT